MPEITLENVRKRFETGWAVHDYTLTVPHGACWSVLGPSGAGKSLLLKLICGIERPTKGQIRVGGKALSALRRWIPATRRGVGFMSQDYPIPETRTVLRHIQTGFRGRGFSTAARDKAIRAMQERLGIEGIGKKLPSQISGGERQRAGLCRALAPGHKILLLDEPLAGLDPHQRQDIVQLIKSLHKELDLTILYVTHYLDEAESLCDHAVLIQDGRIVQAAPWLELRTKPAAPFVGQFLSAPQGRATGLGEIVRQSQ